VVRYLLHHQPALSGTENRRIAVKVINHYGDEVLKVFSTDR